MAYSLQHPAILCVVFFLSCGSHRSNTTEASKTPLTIDPNVILLINQAVSGCENRIGTSPTIAEANALIAPRITELSTLVTTSPTFPAMITTGDASVTIGYRAHDAAYVFEAAGPSWGMAITLTSLPGDLTHGAYEVWQIGGLSSQQITWEYEEVMVPIGQPTAPDDDQIYGYQETLRLFKCRSQEIEAEYHESFDGNYNFSERYAANINGQRITLSAGVSQQRHFIINTCIDNQCATSEGDDWSERKKELPVFSAFVTPTKRRADEQFRLHFMPDHVLELLKRSR